MLRLFFIQKGEDMLKKRKEENMNDISFQEWLEIQKIYKNKIYLKNNSSIVLLKIEPINLKLKSKLEQGAILNQYRLFLKNLKSKIQIIILSKKTDISCHLNEVVKSTNENPQIFDMCNDYINLLKSIVQEKGSITKDFFIALEATNNVENDIMLIKEYLQDCGNDVSICTDSELITVMRNYLNKRTSLMV